MKHCRFCSGIFDEYVIRSTIDCDFIFDDEYYNNFIDFVIIKTNLMFDKVSIQVTNTIYPKKCVYRSEYFVEMSKLVHFSFFSNDSLINYLKHLFEYYENPTMINQIKKKDTRKGLESWVELLHNLTPFERQHSKFDGDHLSLEIYPLGVKVSRAGECKNEVRWRIFDLSDKTKKDTSILDSDLLSYINSGTVGYEENA